MLGENIGRACLNKSLYSAFEKVLSVFLKASFFIVIKDYTVKKVILLQPCYSYKITQMMEKDHLHLNIQKKK